MQVGIIDYQAGNLQSVQNALRSLGLPCRIVSCPDDAADLDALVFPGQGAFGDSVRNLRKSGLWDTVVDWVASGNPYLGICLGYQLLFEGSEECPGVAGLGVFAGTVRKFSPQLGLKIPHMGWNVARPKDPSDPMWQDLPPEPHFYFVHSYFPDPEDDSLVGCVTDYGEPFASGVIRHAIVATQFHPEKSQSAGLQLLRNFFARVSLASP